MRMIGILACGLAMLGSGDESLESLIHQALDQPVELNIQDTPLAEAFATIAEETGVVLELAPEALALLPYGKETKVTARMQNIPLRDGLMHLTKPLGLRFEVRDRRLEVLPTAALKRIGRRATWEEVDTLAWLYGLDFTKGPEEVDWLAERLQFQLDQVEDPLPPLGNALLRVGAGTGDQVLTLATDSLGWTWYPRGRQIVVLSKPAQIDRQLQSLVNVRETHRPLIDVLQRIAEQADVTVRAEPGTIAALPTQTRQNFSLYVENKTAGEAFELVAATTGLGYRIDVDGLVYYHPGQPLEPAGQNLVQQPAVTSQRPDPYVGKIRIEGDDGVIIELLLHESDLSPETNALRRKYLERADAVIKQALLQIEQPDPS